MIHQHSQWAVLHIVVTSPSVPRCRGQPSRWQVERTYCCTPIASPTAFCTHRWLATPPGAVAVFTNPPPTEPAIVCQYFILAGIGTCAIQSYIHPFDAASVHSTCNPQPQPCHSNQIPPIITVFLYSPAPLPSSIRDRCTRWLAQGHCAPSFHIGSRTASWNLGLASGCWSLTKYPASARGQLPRQLEPLRMWQSALIIRLPAAAAVAMNPVSTPNPPKPLL